MRSSSGREWDFSLADIEVPIHLWYGGADNIVPVAHGEHMKNLIPNASLRVRPGEGHLGGLGASHEIFDALLDDWPEPAPTTSEPALKDSAVPA